MEKKQCEHKNSYCRGTASNGVEDWYCKDCKADDFKRKYKVGDKLTNIRSGSCVLILAILGERYIQNTVGLSIQSDGRKKENVYMTWNGKFANKNSEEELNRLYDLVEEDEELEKKISLINNMFI